MSVEPVVHFVRSGRSQGDGRALEQCMPAVMQLAARLACEETAKACQDLPNLLTALLASAPTRLLVGDVLPSVASMLTGNQR
jgi:hypothetical protein